MKPFVLQVLCVLSLVVCGCQHRLEPGGAYAPAVTNAAGVIIPTAAPDLTLFTLDASYDLAYTATLTACRIEKQNRLFLQSIAPGLKREMDKVRAATWQIDQDWAKARAAYLSQPVAANLSAIQRALAEMQRWNAVATSLLPSINAPPSSQ